jgi:2'-5' RNA ligase
LRIFFALWPPREAAEALGGWAREVQKQAGGRATADESIHLTLAFLGDADPARAIRAARRVDAKRFDLALEVARYWSHNKIVWAGPAETPALLATLAERLQLELYREEFILERRPFAAHVTLLRKVPSRPAFPPLPQAAWPAPEFMLVRSRTGREGSRYEIGERFPLG